MRIEIEATAAEPYSSILNQSMNERGMTSHSQWLRPGIPPDLSGQQAARHSNAENIVEVLIVQGSVKRRGLGCVNYLPGAAWL